MFHALMLASAVLTAASGPAAAMDASAHRKQIEDWRHSRVERLAGPAGWLTLVGLEWLKDGVNKLGSSADNTIVQPKWPAHLGKITLDHGRTTIALADGVDATIDGQKVAQASLLDDTHEKATIVANGSVMFFVIKRGDRWALRIKDSDAPTRKGFVGIDYFDIDPSWRIDAKWEAYDPPREIEEPNVLGEIDKVVVPGAAVFEYDGKTFRVEPVIETPGDTELFLVFSDRTSGKETYGAARFVYSQAPKDGRIVIDFNKAYNPPCVFTPYATCPLPTPQNRINARVTAGEKKYRAAVD